MADKMVQPNKDVGKATGPVSGETKGALASGGESQGDATPASASGRKPGFHGGQTEQGYHGPGQLGDTETGNGNANAPSKSKNKK